MKLRRWIIWRALYCQVSGWGVHQYTWIVWPASDDSPMLGVWGASYIYTFWQVNDWTVPIHSLALRVLGLHRFFFIAIAFAWLGAHTFCGSVLKTPVWADDFVLPLQRPIPLLWKDSQWSQLVNVKSLNSPMYWMRIPTAFWCPQLCMTCTMI